jgi:hypothetical protein
MDQETELGYKLRQVLNHGTENLDRSIEKRLHAARQQALQHQRVAVRGLQLAGVGHFFADSVLSHARSIFAALSLIIGAGGTYLWHEFEQAAENEEVDSALLSDELPPAAYLDRGFRAWLERSSHSSQ